MDGGGVDVLVECDERRGDARAWWEGFPVVPDEVPAADMKSVRLKLGVCCLGARGWSVRRLLGTLLRRSALGFAMKELATVPAEGPTLLVFTETVEVGVSLATIELAGSKEVIKGFQNCIVDKIPRNTEGTEIVLR